MTTIRKPDVSVPRPSISSTSGAGPSTPVTTPKPVGATAKSTFTASKAEVKARQAQVTALDAKLKAAGVPDDVRTRTTDALKKMSPTDFARESKLLGTAMSGPNGDRAVAAWDKIQTVAASSPEAAKRLTPEVREALVRGVAERRSVDDVGQEGVLGVKQAEEAAKALAAMPQAQYDAVSRALSTAGVSPSSSPRADPQAERALILKAVASRADRLQANPVDELVKKLGLASTTEAERAMNECTAFADDIRGEPRDEMLRTTTAIDFEAANTSNIDPNDLPVDGAKGADTRGNNDGLYQRFEDTCGPTTSQITRSEADPVFARKLHDNGLNSSDPTTDTAKQQLETLEKTRFFDVNGKEVVPTSAELNAWNSDPTKLPATATQVDAGSTTDSRRADQVYDRTNAQIDALGGREFMKTSTRKLLNGDDLGIIESAAANFTLGTLRAANGGHPTEAEVTQMQTERGGNHKGMRLGPALREIASPGTHVDYKTNWVGSGGMTSGGLDTVDARLKNGQDVPFRVSNTANTGGHFMMMSDVRGKTPDRTYLVSDPYSGRTAWVKEQDMTNTTNPTWLNAQFGLGWTKITHTYTE